MAEPSKAFADAAAKPSKALLDTVAKEIRKLMNERCEGCCYNQANQLAHACITYGWNRCVHALTQSALKRILGGNVNKRLVAVVQEELLLADDDESWYSDDCDWGLLASEEEDEQELDSLTFELPEVGRGTTVLQQHEEEKGGGGGEVYFLSCGMGKPKILFRGLSNNSLVKRRFIINVYRFLPQKNTTRFFSCTFDIDAEDRFEYAFRLVYVCGNDDAAFHENLRKAVETEFLKRLENTCNARPVADQRSYEHTNTCLSQEGGEYIRPLYALAYGGKDVTEMFTGVMKQTIAELEDQVFVSTGSVMYKDNADFHTRITLKRIRTSQAEKLTDLIDSRQFTPNAIHSVLKE